MRRNDANVGPVEAASIGPRSKWSYILLLLSLGAIADLGYGVVDSRHIRIERISVSLPELTPALGGFSIIQLSDLHSTPDFNSNREAARLLEGIPADMMIFTGDFRNSAGTSAAAAEGTRLVIAPVMRRMPVYAVRGNNDSPETMRRIGAEGVQVLDNRAVQLKEGLWLAGWNPYPKGHPTLSQVMAEVPSNATVVLASHSPDVILEQGYTRAQLILTGHTHGLQIRIPGLPPLVTMTRVGWRYTRGLYSLNGRFLYINRGIGTTMIPLRVYSAPEITVLTLSPTIH